MPRRHLDHVYKEHIDIEQKEEEEIPPSSDCIRYLTCRPWLRPWPQQRAQYYVQCAPLIYFSMIFYCIWLRSTSSYSVLLRSTSSYSVLLRSTSFYFVLLRPTAFYCILPCSTAFYFIWLCPTSFDFVLPHSTSSYLVLLRPTSFYFVLPRSYCTLRHLTSF